MNAQKGVTLINLLIGLLIAMLCIIAVLSLYRIVVHTGADSRKAATHDSQLQQAFSTTQMLIQNAGFGLDSTIPQVTMGNIAITGTNQTNVQALLWREAEYANGPASCYGLADIAVSGARQLISLKSTDANCSSANLTTLTWIQDRVLAQLSDISADSSNPAQVIFNLNSTACTPYGAGNLAPSVLHPNITVSATTSTHQTINMNICLLNIVASS